MARLIYPDPVALIELQLDVLAGNYAADRDDDTNGRCPVPSGIMHTVSTLKRKNGQPKKGQPFP